jgi:hypothetical protein
MWEHDFKRHLRAGALLLTLSLSAVGCAGSSPPCVATASSVPSERERQLEAQVAALQGEVSSLRAALASFRPNGRDGNFAEVDASFSEEPVDPSWAARAEQGLRELLAPQVAEGTAIVSLECRSTRCLLRATHASVAAKRKLEQFMRGRPRGFVGTVSWSDESMPGVNSTHYFMRAGAKWPDAGASVQ